MNKKARKVKDQKEFDVASVLGGTLNLLGLKFDVGELVGSQEHLKERLEELRSKLKAAGGKETLSDEEWRRGGASVSGYVRTHGLLGEREFHVGTLGTAGKAVDRRPGSGPVEAVEPPTDVFDEDEEVVIIADIPAVSLEDLELKLQGRLFSLATKPTAPRSYRKELRLKADLEPDGFRATCHNGVLEVRLQKRSSRKHPL